MKIKVVNQRLYLEPPETAEGTREYLKAEFSFSEEWDGMTKTAFFRGADGENHPKLLEDDTCTVPAEALTAPGRGIRIRDARRDGYHDRYQEFFTAGNLKRWHSIRS